MIPKSSLDLQFSAAGLERIEKPHFGSETQISAAACASAPAMYFNTFRRPPFRFAKKFAFPALRKQVFRHALGQPHKNRSVESGLKSLFAVN